MVKNKNKSIKKKNFKNSKLKNFNLFLVFFLSFLLMLNSVNSTTFFDNQNSIINEINNAELQNTILPDVLVGNGSTGNMGYTISLTTEPLYLGFYSQTGNNSQFQIVYKLGVGSNSITKTINFTSQDVYYIKFTPNSVNDYVNFQLNNIAGSQISYTIFNVNDNGRGFSSVTNTMVGSMTDLIDINIGFWKLFYYLFIFGIIIGSLGLLVNFAFKLYDWADRTGKKKREIFYGGKNNKGE